MDMRHTQARLTRLVITKSFCMLDATQACNSAIKADITKYHAVIVFIVILGPWWGYGKAMELLW